MRIMLCVFLLVLLSSGINSVKCYGSDVKNSIKETLTVGEPSSEDILGGLFGDIYTTVVLSIPNDSGDFYIQTLSDYAAQHGKLNSKDKVNGLKDLTSRIRDLYNKKLYKRLILNGDKDVSYKYIFDVISIFEATITDEKLPIEYHFWLFEDKVEK